ncbi:hypothetical protein C8A03DRAFT_17189, partial [Achaetomium macrosporum]
PEMSPTAGTGCADGVALSVRLSCDRCRAQKLKCSVPAGSQACQRCKRAKAPCVFGRRTPSKRRLSKTGRGDRGSISPQIPPCSPAQQAPITPGSLATPASPVALVSVSRCPDFTLDRQLDAPMAFEQPAGLPATISEMEPGSFDCRATWNSPTLGLQHLDPDMSDRGSSAVGYEWDWMQSGWPLSESSVLDPAQPDLALWSQLATPATEGLVAASETGDSSRNTTDSNNATVVPGQQLTGLVSEIQRQLRKLEEGPWHADSASSLDDYPVGTVLALAQQFSALAGPILGCVGGELDEGGDEDDSNWKTDSSAANNDTPTILLVMCGYMWLVRIYGVVLGHFQKHLDQRPANQQLHVGTSAGGARRVYGTTIWPIDGGGDGTHSVHAAGSALRLGELPCADATLGLQQIHTAVRMLLDALHDIESQLGRGATVARAMAVTSLLKSGKSPDSDGSSGALGKKATAVKELLRQKMGL